MALKLLLQTTNVTIPKLCHNLAAYDKTHLSLWIRWVCLGAIVGVVIFYFLKAKLNFCTVEPPNKGHFGTSHFVLYREAVLFLEVKNVLVQWEGCAEMCPLQGGCPFLRGSFIRGPNADTFGT